METNGRFSETLRSRSAEVMRAIIGLQILAGELTEHFTSARRISATR
jgi:hypothetical protein